MQFNNMYKGTFIQEYRLRGFSIDPNVVIGTFAPAFAIDIASGAASKGQLAKLFVNFT